MAGPGDALPSALDRAIPLESRATLADEPAPRPAPSAEPPPRAAPTAEEAAEAAQLIAEARAEEAQRIRRRRLALVGVAVAIVATLLLVFLVRGRAPAARVAQAPDPAPVAAVPVAAAAHAPPPAAEPPPTPSPAAAPPSAAAATSALASALASGGPAAAEPVPLPEGNGSPDSPDAVFRHCMEEGARDTEQGDFAAAAVQYRRALNMKPGSLEAQEGLGGAIVNSSGAAGNYAEATKLLTEVLRADAKRPRAWLFLGAAQQFNGQYASALESYRTYLELAPNDRWAKEVRDVVKVLGPEVARRGHAR
jgi:tetratricopeptide (TPR) repeat protein